MTRSHRASPLASVALLAALAALPGCAANGSGAGRYSLDGTRSDLVRQLTMQCYWHHDGHRVVFGAPQVHSACRRWAEQRVRVQIPDRADWN